MKIPFTSEQFLDVFYNYNNAVYPVQIVFNLLALLLIIQAVLKIPGSGKLFGIVLSLLWFWMGTVYHIIYFSSINKAAYLFGILFIVQAIFFVYEGVIKNNLSFEFRRNINSMTGLILIIYALLIYPVLGFYSGHVYPKAPTFGLPCPTVIFTFGFILFSISRVRLYLLVIPLLWALIGTNAALYLGIKEDFGLLTAGMLTLLIIVLHNSKIKSVKPAAA